MTTSTYEVTWQLPNGDWEWTRLHNVTFQEAVRAALPAPNDSSKELIRVERIDIAEMRS